MQIAVGFETAVNVGSGVTLIVNNAVLVHPETLAPVKV
jgi:hypothetical protein